VEALAAKIAQTEPHLTPDEAFLLCSEKLDEGDPRATPRAEVACLLWMIETNDQDDRDWSRIERFRRFFGTASLKRGAFKERLSKVADEIGLDLPKKEMKGPRRAAVAEPAPATEVVRQAPIDVLRSSPAEVVHQPAAEVVAAPPVTVAPPAPVASAGRLPLRRWQLAAAGVFVVAAIAVLALRRRDAALVVVERQPNHEKVLAAMSPGNGIPVPADDPCLPYEGKWTMGVSYVLDPDAGDPSANPLFSRSRDVVFLARCIVPTAGASAELIGPDTTHTDVFETGHERLGERVAETTNIVKVTITFENGAPAIREMQDMQRVATKEYPASAFFDAARLEQHLTSLEAMKSARCTVKGHPTPKQMTFACVSTSGHVVYEKSLTRSDLTSL
jgi:hypothetical protein